MPSVISGDANVSATEFGYLDGVTSGLQSQLDAITAVANGKIVSVASVTSGSTFNTSSTSFVDVTGMSITVTPQKATNTFILGFSSFQNRSGGDLEGTYQFERGGTGVGSVAQQAIGTSPYDIVLFFPDSPATASAITYKVQAKTSANTLNVYSRAFFVLEIDA